MTDCGALLDRVIAACRAEHEALDREDLDSLEDLTRERALLLKQVWDAREYYDRDLLRLRLQEVLEVQQDLAEAARVLNKKLHDQYNAGLKQARYFDNDRRLHAQLRKSLYCDAMS